jgi:hypothetical protein
MRKILARFIVLVLLFDSSSCAYLFHGTSDQINIYSGDTRANLYLNGQLIGVGNATATVDRDVHYEITAKAPECADQTVTTGDKFDPTSLLGIFIDFGIISILVIDMAASGAAWKTYPLSYTVTPVCPEVTRAAAPSSTVVAPASVIAAPASVMAPAQAPASVMTPAQAAPVSVQASAPVQAPAPIQAPAPAPSAAAAPSPGVTE